MRVAALALLALAACSHPPEWWYHDGATKVGPFASKEACESLRKWASTVSYTVSPCYTREGIPSS